MAVVWLLAASCFAAPMRTAQAQAPIVFTHVSVVDITSASPRADQTSDRPRQSHHGRGALRNDRDGPRRRATRERSRQVSAPGPLGHARACGRPSGTRACWRCSLRTASPARATWAATFATLSGWRDEIKRGTLVGPRPHRLGSVSRRRRRRSSRTSRCAGAGRSPPRRGDSLIHLGVDFVKNPHAAQARYVLRRRTRGPRARESYLRATSPATSPAAEASDSGQRSLEHHLLRIPKSLFGGRSGSAQAEVSGSARARPVHIR